MPAWVIVLAGGSYLGLLFVIAYRGDKAADAGRSLIANPYTYALSIAVYCTSWTFFGSVGRSATTGYGFLPVYIGPVLVFVFAQPFLRKLTLRLPRAMWPIPKAYGHVMAFTEDGKVLADLQDPSGAYPETTAVTETPERLYIQSLHAKGLGWMPK